MDLDVDMSKLVEQANALASATQGTDFVVLRGVQQLSDTSRRLAGRAYSGAGSAAGADQQQQAPDALSSAAAEEASRTKAHFFLSKQSFDPSRLTKALHNINLRNTAFQPTGPEVDTDVDGYLRSQHQLAVQSVIEDARIETEELYTKHCAEAMQAGWAAAKRDLLERWGIPLGGAPYAPATGVPATPGRLGGAAPQQTPMRSTFGASRMGQFQSPAVPATPGGAFGATTMLRQSQGIGTQQMDPRAARYQQAVESIVMQQRERERSQPGSPHPVTVLGALSAATEEVEDREATERKRATRDNWRALLSMLGAADSQTSPGAAKMLAGAQAFLESQFRTMLEEYVRNNPDRAMVGGAPSPAEKVRGFLRARQIPAQFHAWAFVFYCLRCGMAQEAAEGCRMLDACGSEVSRAILQIQSTRSAERDVVMQLSSELQRCKRSNPADPYKATVLNLLSREDNDVATAPYSSVIVMAHDYFWARIVMLDYNDPAALTAAPAVPTTPGRLMQTSRKPTLAALQEEAARNHGAPDPARNPLVDFQILALTLQFPKAVERLLNDQQFFIEGLHFAIALYLRGLLPEPLNQPKNLKAQSVIASDVTGVAINVPRLIYAVAERFPEDARRVCTYLGTLPEHLIVECLRTYLLVDLQSDPAPLLASRILEMYLPENAVMQAVELAAREAETSRATEKAICFYKHIRNADKVLEILTSQLGSLMSQRPSPTRERIVEMVIDVIKQPGYIQEARNDQVKKNFHMVARVADWFDEYHKGNYHEAINLLATLEFVPMTNDATRVAQKAENCKLLPREIIQNLSDILLAAMSSLQRLYEQAKINFSRSRDQNSLELMRSLQSKAKALVMFAVCPPLDKISSEKMSSLNQMQMSMQ